MRRAMIELINNCGTSKCKVCISEPQCARKKVQGKTLIHIPFTFEFEFAILIGFKIANSS
jgi:hypothetical protein